MIRVTVERYNRFTEQEKMEFALWLEEERMHDVMDLTVDGRTASGCRFMRNESGKRYYDRESQRPATEEFVQIIRQQPPVSTFQAMARMDKEDISGRG